MKSITADYHTHTIFSHGKGSVEDNVKAAIQKGLREIAITDHGPAHMSYGIRKKAEYLEEIKRCAQKYGDIITVKSGIELNLIGDDGELELPERELLDYDIRIFGYHKFVKPKSLSMASKMYISNLLFKSNSREFILKVTKAYKNVIKSGLITIVAHPGYGMPVDIIALGHACKRYETYFEINNSHGEMDEAMLRAVEKTGCDFVLSSDAHCPKNVGEVSKALKKAEQAGIESERIVNL